MPMLSIISSPGTSLHLPINTSLLFILIRGLPSV
uniref:Uncharacterized protein n=1 Tax=Anguilla anguilla TaxID=7936 RepID=A0A0E9PSM0_ANGAN